MLNREIKIKIPNDIFIALNVSESEFQKTTKTYMAIHLYQTGKLTIGKAAQLAGLSRLAFEHRLAENEIPISRLETEDIKKDVQKLADKQ